MREGASRGTCTSRAEIVSSGHDCPRSYGRTDVALTAMLGDRRLISIDLEEEDWRRIHRPKRPAGLRCPTCSAAMYAKERSLTRFFAHAPGASNCASNGESSEHLRLKLEVVKAARGAGWLAEPEWRRDDDNTASDRIWIADVLCTDPRSHRRIAFEIQLSPQTPEEARLRTERYRADGIETIWIAGSRRPWTIDADCVIVDRDYITGGLFTGNSSAPDHIWHWDPVERNPPLVEWIPEVLDSRWVSRQVHASLRAAERGWVRPHDVERSAHAAERAAQAQQQREQHQKNRDSWLQRRKATSDTVQAALRSNGFGFAAMDSPLAGATVVQVPDGGADAAMHYLVCPIAGKIDGFVRSFAKRADVTVAAAPDDFERLARLLPSAVLIRQPEDVPLPDLVTVDRVFEQRRGRAREKQHERGRSALDRIAKAWELDHREILAGAIVEGDEVYAVIEGRRHYGSPTCPPPSSDAVAVAFSSKDEFRIRRLGWEIGVNIEEAEYVLQNPEEEPSRGGNEDTQGIEHVTEVDRTREIEQRPSAPAVEPTRTELSRATSRLISWLSRHARSADVRRERGEGWEVVHVDGAPTIAIASPGVNAPAATVNVTLGGHRPSQLLPAEGWLSVDSAMLAIGPSADLIPLHDYRFEASTVFARPSSD